MMLWKDLRRILGYQSGDKVGLIHEKTVAKISCTVPLKDFAFICAYYYNFSNHAFFGFQINRLSRITALILYCTLYK
jgi:hypothetical protein